MDQELIAYLDERFRESAQALARFRDETNQRFDTIDQRFGTIDQRFDTIDQRFGTIDQRFGTIDQRFDTIDQRIDQVEEGVRHTQVLVEDVRSDVRLLAEGVSSFDGKLDAVRLELKEEIGEVRSLLEASYRDMDRRIG
jgi:archaellum component FlaC